MASIRRVAEIARIEVQQADAPDAFGHRPHERHDGSGAELGRAILAVRRQVLGDEHDLGHAELVDLVEDRRHVTAALLAAERRDGAEPARTVAALGDLDVGPRDGRARPRQVEQVERRQRRRAHRDQRARGRRCRRRRLDEPDPEAGDAIDLRQGRRQLVAVALGHAARHHQARPGLAHLVEGEHGVDRLAPGGVDERARVDHHQVGGGRVVGRRHPVGEQRADELVGVDLVLRAPQGLDVEALRHRDHATDGPRPVKRYWWASRSPGRGQSSVTTRPVPDSVTYAVRSSGPPKHRLVVIGSSVAITSTD